MKIYFLGAKEAISNRDSRFTQAWSRFVQSLKNTSSVHQVTYCREEGDCIIEQSSEEINWRQLFKFCSALNSNTFVWNWGDGPVGRDCGFYCSLGIRQFDKHRHRIINYPIEYNECIELFSVDEAKIDFGFVGGVTSGVRQRLLEQSVSLGRDHNSVFRFSGADWSLHYDADKTGGESRNSYAQFLRTTKFILCPRGHGLGSIRLFETMKAGRVPIIISDGYVLPFGPDWAACSIIIEEGRIESIPSVVHAHLPHWEKMASAARSEWELYFSSKSLINKLAVNLESLSQSRHNLGVISEIRSYIRISTCICEFYARPFLGRIRKFFQA
jgi:hypothetical protein